MEDQGSDYSKKNTQESNNALMQQQNINKKKADALKESLKQIKKTYGEGAIILMDEEMKPVPSLSTGSLLLDKALGVGGLPKGRIVEIFGHEGSGKTTLALHIIASAQKIAMEQGTEEKCAFIDAEHAIDMQLAETLGIKLEDLILAQPDNGEQALEIAETLIRSGSISVLVIDSVAALVPKAELDGEMGEMIVGGQARLMSHALRKISSIVAKTGTIVVFINQIRLKIGVMYGNPETTTGGLALKYAASIRIEVRKKSLIKQKDVPIGQEVEFKICKNKVRAPFKTANVELIYGRGINRTHELIDLAIEQGIIEQRGGWFSMGGVQLSQGRENLNQLLSTDKELFNKIKNKIDLTKN